MEFSALNLFKDEIGYFMMFITLPTGTIMKYFNTSMVISKGIYIFSKHSH